MRVMEFASLPNADARDLLLSGWRTKGGCLLWSEGGDADSTMRLAKMIWRRVAGDDEGEIRLQETGFSRELPSDALFALCLEGGAFMAVPKGEDGPILPEAWQLTSGQSLIVPGPALSSTLRVKALVFALQNGVLPRVFTAFRA